MMTIETPGPDPKEYFGFKTPSAKHPLDNLHPPTATQFDEAEFMVLRCELEFYFPETADVFDDQLALLLGLSRPGGINDATWRQMRLDWIEEAGSCADRWAKQAEQRAEAFLAKRARLWPY